MIDGTVYKLISDKLGEMHSLPVEAQTHLDTIANIIADTNVPEHRVRDANNLTVAVAVVTASLGTRHEQPPQALRDMVVSLQQHVTTEMGSVDDYLDSEGVMVFSSFADLSGLCGFPIAPANVAIPPIG